MAVPTSFTGTLPTQNSYCPPFVSSGADFYIVARDNGDNKNIIVLKNADPTMSGWTEQDAASAPVLDSEALSIWCVQEDDEIHVFSADRDAVPEVHIRRSTFDMSSDTWTTVEEVVADVTTDPPAADKVFVSAGVRSDGDLIAFYSGERSSSRERLYYARWEGASWTADIAVDNGGATDWRGGVVVMGSSDRAHFFFKAGGNGYTRTLTSGNSLETFRSAFASDLCQSACAHVFGAGASYSDGVDQYVLAPYVDEANNYPHVVTLISADTPAAETVDEDITETAIAVGGGVSSARHAFALKDESVWYFQTDDLGTDVVVDANHLQLGWGDDVSLGHDAQQVYPAFLTRDGDPVLAYVYMPYASEVRYNEYQGDIGVPLGDVTIRVDALSNPGGPTWTEITADVDRQLHIHYGISGSDPQANTASPGYCTFVLANFENDGDLGQWTPGHANAPSWWDVGLVIRVVFVSASTGEEFVKFYGKVSRIDPTAGVRDMPLVHVLARDYIAIMAAITVREIDPQVAQTDVAILTEILGALPSTATPPATDVDATLQSFDYALDNVGGGISPLSLIKDLDDSAFSLAFQQGDGTFRWMNRNTRTFQNAKGVFDDLRLLDLNNPTDADRVLREVQVQNPQFDIGASNEVLAEETGEDASGGIASGETIERWLTYRDPQRDESGATLVGGFSFVDPVVASTDYEFNTQADGGGTDITADVDVTASFFSGSVMFEITNNNASTAYRIILQGRGKVIRRRAPLFVTSEGSGEGKFLPLSLPFPVSATDLQFIADYIRSQFELASNNPTRFSIDPRESDYNMRQMLEREPGELIQGSETVTALAAYGNIQNVDIVVEGNNWRCTWELAPESSFQFIEPWELGTASKGELGEVTVLG